MLLEREGFVSRPSWEELKGGARPLPPSLTASWGMATWLAVPRVFRFRTPLSGDRSGQIVRRRTGLWSHSWPRGQSSERGRLWPISTSASFFFFRLRRISISANFAFGQFQFRPLFGCWIFGLTRKRKKKKKKTKKRKQFGWGKQYSLCLCEFRRRFHRNTAYARISGFNRSSCAGSPAEEGRFRSRV